MLPGSLTLKINNFNILKSITDLQFLLSKLFNNCNSFKLIENLGLWSLSELSVKT